MPSKCRRISLKWFGSHYRKGEKNGNCPCQSRWKLTVVLGMQCNLTLLLSTNTGLKFVGAAGRHRWAFWFPLLCFLLSYPFSTFLPLSCLHFPSLFSRVNSLLLLASPPSSHFHFPSPCLHFSLFHSLFLPFPHSHRVVGSFCLNLLTQPHFLLRLSFYST